MRMLGVVLCLVVASPTLTLAQQERANGAEAAPPAEAAVTAPALPAPPPPPDVAPPESAYGKSKGVLPGVLIGPKLAILALPAPGLGVEAKIANVLGLSFDYGLIPDVSIADVTAGYRDWSFAAKLYPWEGSFFLGLAVGRRSFEASARDDMTGLKASVEVASTYLAPEIGWRWVRRSGFFLGMEFGYQLILSSETTLAIPGGIAVATADDVKDAGDEIGKFGLPIVSLLQVGYFF